ncbi:MAG: alkane 1-monooxygenase, partial [Roseicyclus sp.]
MAQPRIIPASQMARLTRALPFWLSLALFPLIAIVAGQGGWWLILLPASTWWLFSGLDAVTGLNQDNGDLETPQADLFWYRLVTLVWFPLQFGMMFGLIWYATRAPHLGGWEQVGLFFGVGVISGTVGITYSHELMHQKNRLERRLA